MDDYLANNYSCKRSYLRGFQSSNIQKTVFTMSKKSSRENVANEATELDLLTTSNSGKSTRFQVNKVENHDELDRDLEFPGVQLRIRIETDCEGNDLHTATDRTMLNSEDLKSFR
ncbi:hypothetical protein JTB14_025598 [Gonioctena quinquepunctata]|nr:hypothetical protein JTB14_025598 [Gonioctena quinquepunctata]